MEPILDEMSLEPCPNWSAPFRILELARTIMALDTIGTRRVLRSVRDAVDRDIGGGLGLKTWCFHQGTNREAGRLVALRLASQPFIDGERGLFSAVEGRQAIEATVERLPAWGAGLAVLTDGTLIALTSKLRSRGRALLVTLNYLDEDAERCETLEVYAFVTAADVEHKRATLIERIDRSVDRGTALLDRAAEMFPRLRFGQRAIEQISALRGTESHFHQLLRHLRVLDETTVTWKAGSTFSPLGVSFSRESKPTLEDGTLGPMRNFPVPDGFVFKRWSDHTKLTGGPGARLYFRAERTAGESVVLIGYFGPHLPTVKYPT